LDDKREMGDQLATPLAHRLITSPLGALLDTRAFERIKGRSLPREMRLARIGALAQATAAEGGDAETLLERLGLHGARSPQLRTRVAKAWARYVRDWHAHAAILKAWQGAFWNGEDLPPDTLVDLERRRRAASERCVTPGRTLGFLAKLADIAPVACDIPDPEDSFTRWSETIAAPDALFAAPEELPDFERSRAVPGPSGPEYLLRFRSPSPLMTDTVHARVFEPAEDAEAAPTFIYASGLGMAYDRIRYWPEEDYIARPLAARGCRVILVESPWHGRRALPGRFSGEPYLATAPVGLFRLYAAQAQETAALIAWARRTGASAVGVGGVSLGGIVSQHVAGRCAAWPEAMRPDMAFLGATSAHIDEVVLGSEITRALGVDAAVRAAGWTAERLRQLRPILDPPASAGIPPENVVAVLGRRDRYTPYALGRGLLDAWGVPHGNVLTWDRDHFGVLLGLFRRDEAQKKILCKLNEIRDTLRTSPAGQ
jgi:hypothetical protein